MEIVQEFTGRYMKVTLEKKAGEFGENILHYNEIDGILGAQVQQVDNSPQYLYEIGDRISLSELFQRGQMTAEGLRELINQLLLLFERAKEYLLDEKDLILISEYTFYDEKKKKLSVAYLDGYGREVRQGISELMESCMNYMNHRDKELIFLVYGLHKISKEENFSVHRLTEMIGEMETGDNEVWQPLVWETGEGNDTKGTEDVARDSGGISGRPPEKERQQPEKGQQNRSAQKKHPVQKERRRYIKIGMYAAAGIFIFAAAIYSGILTKPVSGKPDMMKAVILAGVLVIAEGYLIVKEREMTGGGKERGKAAVCSVDDKTTILLESGSDATVVLDERNVQPLYFDLIPEDWQREEIRVRKSPFFIGKNPEKADAVIGDGEISRVHAKLVVEEEGIYVIDQESTNGTYVNGKRLVPWERKRIGRDDRVGFSSVCYRVEKR